MKDSLLNNIEINAIKNCEERSCLCCFDWSINDAIKHEEELHNVKLDNETFYEIYKNVAENLKDKFICISDDKEDPDALMIYVNKKMYYEDLFEYTNELALNFNEDILNEIEADYANGDYQALADICEDVFLDVCEDQLPGYRETKYELRSNAYKQFLAAAKKEAIKNLELFIKNVA